MEGRTGKVTREVHPAFEGLPVSTEHGPGPVEVAGARHRAAPREGAFRTAGGPGGRGLLVVEAIPESLSWNGSHAWH